MTMEEKDIAKEIESGEENLSVLHLDGSNCDCPECQNGRKHYIQILDMERYVEHLNDWD